MKPVCKKCYEKFPNELKKRISDNLKEREADTLRRRSGKSWNIYLIKINLKQTRKKTWNKKVEAN